MSDEPRLPTPLPEGALCAIHPDRPAARTCARCGNYMCTDCWSGDASGLCLTCASRTGATPGFAYTRDHFSLDGLLNLSLSRWKANWQLLTLTFGGAFMLSYGVSLGGEWVFDRVADSMGPDSRWHSPLHPVRLAFQIFGTVLGVLTQLVVLSVSLDVLAGEKATPQRVFERLQRIPDCLLQVLLTYAVLILDCGLHFGLFLLLGGMSNLPISIAVPVAVFALLIPLRVYVGLGVMFSTLALLVDSELNALSAFARSWRVVAGHRLQALGVTLVCSLIFLVGVLACCVGLMVSGPIATLMYCSLFLALSNRERQAPVLPHEGWQV